MSFFKSISREVSFLSRHRSIAVALVAVLILSSLSVIGGLLEFERQQASIEAIKIADHQDRTAVLAKQDSWGGAAYYSFHLTYDEPDPFAFAAMGQRDTHPWKHRIRMLALEGQIYERDANNPIIALMGRFDFAFFAAFVLPFFIIILLHDLRANERQAGRFYLLVASAGDAKKLWIIRTLIISISLFLCAGLPLVVASLINEVSVIVVFKAVVFLGLYFSFWTGLSYWFASWEKPASVILASVVAGWVLVAVIIPTGGRMLIDKSVPVPSGAAILMTQREAVNDAWDIPKEATMEVFMERHPQWSDYARINRPFEWKWYFAFQEVGDIKTQPLSESYRAGRLERDRLAGYLAYLAPPAWFERSIQQLAKTDTKSSLLYDQKVRAFHNLLKQYYYPKLFQDQPFDKNKLSELPQF